MSSTFEDRIAQEDAYDRGYEAGYYVGIREGYIEATNIKNGTWLEVGWNNYKCSLCNEQYVGMGAITFTYCPNCGAHMIKGMEKNECKS